MPAPFGTNFVSALAVAGNGDLIAGGSILIGATVREQAIEIELDASTAFTRINGGNALIATLGAF